MDEELVVARDILAADVVGARQVLHKGDLWVQGASLSGWDRSSQHHLNDVLLEWSADLLNGLCAEMDHQSELFDLGFFGDLSETKNSLKAQILRGFHFFEDAVDSLGSMLNSFWHAINDPIRFVAAGAVSQDLERLRFAVIFLEDVLEEIDRQIGEEEPDKPEWAYESDKNIRRLLFRSVVIAEYKKENAVKQFAILSEFQKMKWKHIIKSPFTDDETLRQSLRSLNTKLGDQCPIRFRQERLWMRWEMKG